MFALKASGQFRFARVEAEQEVDHDAFEIYGIEKVEKIKVVGPGLIVKVYSSTNWPGLKKGR